MFGKKELFAVSLLAAVGCKMEDHPPAPVGGGGCDTDWAPGGVGDQIPQCCNAQTCGVGNCPPCGTGTGTGTGGDDTGEPCEDPQMVEGVMWDCRGFALGIYASPSGALTTFQSNPGGGISEGDLITVCTDSDPVGGLNAVLDKWCDPPGPPYWNTNCDVGADILEFSLWEKLDACAPWHGDLDADYSLSATHQAPLLQASIDIANSLCVEDCLQAYSGLFQETINLNGTTYTLDHVECEMFGAPVWSSDLLSGEQDWPTTYPTQPHQGPAECVEGRSEAWGASHVVDPTNSIYEDCDATTGLCPCMSMTCYDIPEPMEVYDCDGYAPTTWASHEQGEETTEAYMTTVGKDAVLIDIYQPYACDTGRYAEDGSDWTIEGLTSSSLLYRLGFRNGDTGISVSAYDPERDELTGTTYTLDSVDDMAEAYERLVPAPGNGGSIAFMLSRDEREHTIYVTVG